MKETKRARARTRNYGSPARLAPAVEKTVFPYGRLIVACAAIGAAAIVGLAVLMPPAVVESETAPALPPAPQFSRQPTIELPAVPAEATTAELRSELLEMSSDLVARYPELPQALHVVALLYADLQKSAEAMQLWKKCIELAPHSEGPYVGLARAAMQLGEDETAVTTLQQALGAGCSTAEIYRELSAALSKLGRLDEAAAAGEEGVRKFPQAASLWRELGQAQLQLDRFAEAEASLERAIAEGEQSDAVLFSLATATSRQGKDEAAAKYRAEFSRRKAAQQASAQVPFQARYDGELRGIAVVALCGAGGVFGRQGDVARAELSFLRAYQLDPASTAACAELIRLYRGQQRIADARLVQERLIELEPEVVPHYVNYASLSAQVGEMQAAETSLKKVIGLRPELAIGYTGLAQLYLQQGSHSQARWFAEAALRQESSGPDETVQTLFALAAAREQLGDREGAEAAMAEARKIAPTDPRLRLMNTDRPTGTAVPTSKRAKLP